MLIASRTIGPKVFYQYNKLFLKIKVSNVLFQSSSFSSIFASVVLLSLLCYLEAKPVIYTKDKGVNLPVLPSAVNKSWCRSALFKERITEPGCESKLVYNRFCYGQCMSFYVPRYPLESFRSCTACVPVVMEKKIIRLKCPQRKSRVLMKEITLVKSCRCRADIWDKSKGTKPN